MLLFEILIVLHQHGWEVSCPNRFRTMVALPFAVSIVGWDQRDRGELFELGES